MSDRPSLEEQVETHLKQALGADSFEEKDFHIRSALQVGECQKLAEQTEYTQTD